MNFRKLVIVACLWCACLSTVQASTPAKCAADNALTRRVVDMAGRTIVLPKEIHRIATVGSVPVLNGYLFALGAGQGIVNGLPSRFTAAGRWRLHNTIAPHLADRPVLQGQATSPVSIEHLMQLDADVVITMDLLKVRTLEAAKVPVVYLEWGSMSDIRTNMQTLGCVLDRTPQSTAYLNYFDEIMEAVRDRLEVVSQEARPKVLYFNPDTMSTPLLIANWWITQAGGHSVTASMDRGGNTHYSHERVLVWNPDILIVNSPEQVQAVYQDERYSKINAVQNRQVYVTPMGVHSWGQRTVEQPLTVLWAAKIFHPTLFASLDIEGEVRSFYHRFFNYELSDDGVKAMLQGLTYPLGEQ